METLACQLIDIITIKDMRSPISWGTDLEILAISTMLQCTTHVWCDLTGGAAWAHIIGGTRHWAHLVPLFYNSTCVSYINTHYNLYIYHNRSRNHYDRVVVSLP